MFCVRYVPPWSVVRARGACGALGVDEGYPLTGVWVRCNSRFQPYYYYH